MKIILVSHGDFAKSLLGSAQMIIGEQSDAVAFGLYPEDDITQLADKLKQEIIDTDKDEKVLFVTDLFSGSPFNAVVSLMSEFELSHVTGMNLPLVLQLLLTRTSIEDPDALIDGATKETSQSIVNVNRFLKETM